VRFNARCVCDDSDACADYCAQCRHSLSSPFPSTLGENSPLPPQPSTIRGKHEGETTSFANVAVAANKSAEAIFASAPSFPLCLRAFASARSLPVGLCYAFLFSLCTLGFKVLFLAKFRFIFREIDAFDAFDEISPQSTNRPREA
jgi:hypothetical protein